MESGVGWGGEAWLGWRVGLVGVEKLGWGGERGWLVWRRGLVGVEKGVVAEYRKSEATLFNLFTFMTKRVYKSPGLRFTKGLHYDCMPH